MDRTEATLRKLLTALPAPGYDLGILSERGMYRLEAVPASRILRTLPYLKYRNVNGAHIYIRPTGESPYTLLDDLSAITLARLTPEGYAPAAVVETSPGNYQAWLRHAQPLSKALGTLAAKTLAERFDANTSAADWRRFGRAPGFTNRKPQHRTPRGLYPFACLISHTGQPLPNSDILRSELEALQSRIEEERIALRFNFAARPSRSVVLTSLSRFVRLHVIKAVPPLQIWRFASPLALRAGPNPTLQPHSAATTFPETRIHSDRTLTSAAHFPKPFAGQPPGNRGRIPFGFSPTLFPLASMRSVKCACWGRSLPKPLPS